MTLDPSTNSPRNYFEFQKAEIEGSIPKRFEKQVGQYPDRLALKYGDERLTYSELNHGANQVAHAILNKYKNKDKPVAFLLEHGTSQITAMLGILIAGNFSFLVLPLAAITF